MVELNISDIQSTSIDTASLHTAYKPTSCLHLQTTNRTEATGASRLLSCYKLLPFSHPVPSRSFPLLPTAVTHKYCKRSQQFGPEPALQLSMMSTKRYHWKWSVCEQNKRWHNIQGCRQAKQLVLGVNTWLSKYALRLPRRNVRILIGLLTGHNTLNRHLALVKRQSDATCPLCKDEQETSLHFLGRCSTTMAQRMQYFERPFLIPCELRQEHWATLLWLVHIADKTDKTRLSCLVLSCQWCELNWRQDKTVGNWKFRNSIVQSRSAVWLSLVLSWPSFQFARNVVTYCDVIFGNWVKTSSQMRSNHRQDWTNLFCLQYIENCLHLLRTQFTPPTRQDKTVLSCQCRRCELAIKVC